MQSYRAIPTVRVTQQPTLQSVAQMVETTFLRAMQVVEWKKVSTEQRLSTSEYYVSKLRNK
jgi:hypothetical protein